MSKLRSVVAALALLTNCVAVAQVDEPEKLRIHGSNVLGAQLVPDLVVAWLRSIDYGEIRRSEVNAWRTQISASRDGERLIVEIDKQGTATGFRDIVSGDAEIGMSARAPDARELDDAWQLGDLRSPGQEWVVALDGMTAIVPSGSPVSSLTMPQLRDVLAGKIRDWRQLGGASGAIHLHLAGGTRAVAELALQVGLSGKPALPATTHANQAQVTAAVAGDPGALGIIGLRGSRSGVQALAIRSGQSLVPADMLALRSEDYPLAHRLYFHTGQLITALGRGFVLYAVSPAGQAVVDRSRFVSLSLVPMDSARTARAPVEYRKYVAAARRLPMALRFSTGLDLFDSRSRQDLSRLAVWLARRENSQRRLVLVGFANPDPQDPYQALTLSQERADYVASELLALGMKVVTVRGMGGKMALANRADTASRQRNDRVEVWIR
jgi:phosphate transport system substrate-binding protein